MGIDGLSLKVQQILGRAPAVRTPFAIAVNRRIKLLVWDGTGVLARLT